MSETPAHILVIEDDPGIARSLTTGLEQSGFRVTWKSTGAQGMAFARDFQPHLIILDVRLPDGSGFDVCAQLRRLHLRQPIIMLTVQGEEADKVLGLELGADDYMTKPYSLRELVSRVRANLRRVYGELSSAGGDTLVVEDLVVDLDRSQVSRIKGGGAVQALNLTPTEYRLFVHLARHRGQALSRSQLLDAVWGWDANVESEKTVNVHIRRLREKVEHDPSRPTLILTVPGIGYRLAG
jgi:DNA-binding response OmpR family regulator